MSKFRKRISQKIPPQKFFKNRNDFRRNQTLENFQIVNINAVFSADGVFDIYTGYFEIIEKKMKMEIEIAKFINNHIVTINYTN